MKRKVARIAGLLALGLLPFVLLRFEAVRNALVSLMDFMRREGAIGAAAFFGTQVTVSLITAPLWLMSGVAGYVYGFPYGYLLALPGVTAGACACFLGARLVLGASLSARPVEKGFWTNVHRAVGAEGLKITLLLRLTFAAPQNLISYLLAATPLKARHFAFGTLAGTAPATLFHVYLGSLVPSAAELIAGGGAARGPFAYVGIAIGLLMTVTALYVTSRLARKALSRALDAAG